MVQERLWTDHHTPHHHIHHKGPLVCPSSSDSEYCKESESPASSDSEDLHYGPGIVNRLRNKYLSLALRESNPRPTILRKATSLENLLDDDGGRHVEKDDGFIRRTSANNEGGNRYRSASRRQEMKRARSVEVISRANHEDDLVMSVSVTTKINNRQSLHEDMLKHTNEEKPVQSDKPKTFKVPSKETNGNGEEISDKFSRRINRPKRISPLLNEREKPPVDVVKHAKMIFEKKPETRTKKPHHTGKVAAEVKSFNDMIVKTKLAAKVPWKPIKIAKPPTYGDVAAKVDSFNDIIVKNNVVSTPTKPTIKTSKPVLTDKSRSNTHHHVRPAKPVILSEEILKPKTLELSSPKQEKKDFNNLPSPIPDVSIVDRRSQDGIDFRNNSKNSLCETPDLILTSSPIQKISSPTYRKQTTENFITEERIRSYGSHPEATNKFVSPIHSPIKVPVFNRLSSETVGFISPNTQKNITKNSSTYNFLNSEVDQRHLPSADKNSVNIKESLQEHSDQTNNTGNKVKQAFNIEKNVRNIAKSEKKERETKTFVEDEVETEKHTRTEQENTDIGASRVSTSKNEELSKSNGQNNPSWLKPEFKLNKVNSSITADPTRSMDSKSKNQDYKVPDLVETDSVINSSTNIKNTKPKDEAKGFEKVDQSVVKPVQSGSVNGSGSAVNNTSVEDSRPIKIIIPKKTKPKKEEATSAVFNFTARTDVPDYISNDTSRVPSRPVIPKPDEPGIKLLPDALLSNYKEFQDMWEEDELIRSLEARPPSPCDVTFINDNILIDGKSSFIQRSSKRVKLNISFVDDAEIYEYPSEISLLVEESQFSTIGGSAQVGHNTPTLSGSSLATYTPKSTEDFQLGVMKTFQDIPTPCTKASVQEPSENINDDVLLEEVDKPVLFSSGSTSILF